MKNLLKITLTLLTGIVISVGIFRPGLLMGTSASTAVGNWYQQFLPNLGGRQLVDITFTDSLNGHAITTRLSATDTTFIIKTTNKGDSWFVSFHDSGVVYTSMQFINQSTGFVGGYIYKGGLFKIVKTTNAGVNWFYINAPFDVPISDLYSFNEDSIWLASSSLTGNGGVFFTSNGGANWQVQYQGNNPGHIYMYDRNLGFISPPTTGALYRTTNSGLNWL
ncbi:MAG TPA: hypothetical protein VG961_10725, partial [Ignavibacteria bacterium]|nr:hypothetical protein [Ignavibacteria bacterium]